MMRITLYPCGYFARFDEENQCNFYYHFHHTEFNPETDKMCYQIVCGKCGAQIEGDTKQETIDNWNRRV